MSDPDFTIAIGGLRTSTTLDGREVTLYGVQAISRDDGRQRLSWHRYSAFQRLHEQLAPELGLPSRFPCHPRVHTEACTALCGSLCRACAASPDKSWSKRPSSRG